jgi:hypothetical protein
LYSSLPSWAFREHDQMKSIIAGFAAIALAILSLSIPAPIFTTAASADARMTGAGNCSGGVCTEKGKATGTGTGTGTACPAGTCSKAGTPYAKDKKYCSAANCRK